VAAEDPLPVEAAGAPVRTRELPAGRHELRVTVEFGSLALRRVDVSLA
jgi:hypothetical protein